MKVDEAGTHPVAEPFAFCQMVEYNERAILYRLWEPARAQDLSNSRQRQWLLKPVLDPNLDLRRVDRATHDLLMAQGKSGQTKSLEAIDELLEGEPGIDQGAEHH